MITISSNFIGNFKLGDNIVHNLSILRELYAAQTGENPEQRELFRKPIIIIIGSICEAILFDLYLKIEQFVNEGVPNIPDKVLVEIRTKTIDEFAKYIDNARSKGLLGEEPQLYDNLHELRKLRNRVHIQNSRGHFEPDDSVAFNEDRQNSAEEMLEKTLKIMERDYAREKEGGYVCNFILPWGENE